jgi:hypothetical protein
MVTLVLELLRVRVWSLYVTRVAMLAMGLMQISVFLVRQEEDFHPIYV